MKKTISEMDRKELESAYDLMRRRYNSMIDANNALSTKNEELEGANKVLQQMVATRDSKIDVNMNLLQELADNQNQQKDSMALEIKVLQNRIKELEDGDLN